MQTSAVNANARRRRKTRSHAVTVRRFSVATVKKIIFTDEKDFILEVPTNRQNDRVNFMQRAGNQTFVRTDSITTEIGFQRIVG